MHAGLRLISVLGTTAVLSAAGPAASSAATGGASADSAAGGPLDAGATVYGAPVRQRPVARVFRVSPRTVREGVRPLLRVRVDERGVERVSARVVVLDASSGAVAARFSLGRLRTGRVVRVRWPASRMVKPGSYRVRLHVRDPQGAVLARAARARGVTRLVVRPRPRPEISQPEPQEQPNPPAAPAAPVVVAGGVFPVQGTWSFGGAGSRFGAGRKGHTHEGQDIAAPIGTPVVSPLPGVVKFTDDQPSGAGLYVVVDADDGRSMFFAHCQERSIGVTPGQRVTAGQGLCRVGMTGSTSGPHLHFELWEGGWRDRGGRPVDPLPQLQAWAGR